MFKELLSDTGSVSSKRVAGLEILQVIVVMVLGNQFTKYKLDMAVLITLIGFVLTCFGMNAVLQAKSISAKQNVASDIVNSTGENDAAQEVMKSDKP